MDASCACGSVTFTIPASKPLGLYHCHCIDCRKQSGSAFGTSAQFPYFAIPANPAISSFIKSCDSGRRKRCFFCNQCGSRIMHETVVEGGHPEKVTVKGGLIDQLNWKGGIHIFAKSALMPIPEGAEIWEGEPEGK